MGKRPRAKLIILCEDSQQAVFAKHFFIRRGFASQKITLQMNTKGSGEQFVRTEYAKQVKFCRQTSSYSPVGTYLVVLIDADNHTYEQRLRQLDESLEDDGQPKRQPNEKIAIFVPKRNIETWIHYLMGKAVDEKTAYPKLARQRECRKYVDKLVKKICPIGLPEDAPPSLRAACEELQRIL